MATLSVFFATVGSIVMRSDNRRALVGELDRPETAQGTIILWFFVTLLLAAIVDGLSH